MPVFASSWPESLFISQGRWSMSQERYTYFHVTCFINADERVNSLVSSQALQSDVTNWNLTVSFSNHLVILFPGTECSRTPHIWHLRNSESWLLLVGRFPQFKSTPPRFKDQELSRRKNKVSNC